DPFLRLRGVSGGWRPGQGMSGGEDRVVASNGTQFSYRYAIPADPARGEPRLEYVNHTQGATFTLRSLAWSDFSGSPSAAPGEPDTVTFTGYGTWSRDPAGWHPAAVQVSTARGAEYVSI